MDKEPFGLDHRARPEAEVCLETHLSFAEAFWKMKQTSAPKMRTKTKTSRDRKILLDKGEPLMEAARVRSCEVKTTA